MHSLLDHLQVYWLNRPLLKNQTEDGAMPSLLLKTQSLPSRLGGVGPISLAGSAPGEKLVALYSCCRYGPDWAQWREINGGSPKDGNEATLNLNMDAKSFSSLVQNN